MAFVVLLLSLYKKGTRPLLEYAGTRPGLFGLCALIAVVTCVAIVLWRYRLARRGSSRVFLMTVTLNLLSVTVALAIAEVAVRMLTVPLFDGSLVINDSRLLLPRDWETVADRYRQRLGNIGDYVFTYDAHIGWRLRPRMSDPDTLYTTSVEGLRSARPDVAYRERQPAARVALVGDSFTYAEDVPFIDSWGHRLEQELGPDVQVLNFGVPAYGIDQAWLAYEHRAKAWQPDIVLFGILPADLERAMAVYPFIRRPTWRNPYSKPRLVSSEDGLAVINSPTATPEFVFSQSSITDLPHLAFDRGYRDLHWRRHRAHASYLVRFFASRFPRQHVPSEVNNDTAMETLARDIFREFTKSVSGAGSTPLLVYLPNRRDVGNHLAGRDRPTAAMRILRSGDPPFIDLTECVAKVADGERYMFGGSGHFTPSANAAVAACLAAEIGPLLRAAHTQP